MNAGGFASILQANDFQEGRNMRLGGRAGSENIEDRRGMGGGGMRAGLPLGGGIGGIVLLLVIAAVTGQNPLDMLGGGSGGDAPYTDNVPGPDNAESQLVRVVLKDTEDTWHEIFRERGSDYQEPTLVMFTNATESACGLGQAAMGPFYCPRDRKVYLDTAFFDELDQRFGAPGDFAQAYVIAHEVGHHVQTLTGLSDRVAGGSKRGCAAAGHAA